MLVSCLCISVFYTNCGGELPQLLLLASTLAVYEAVLVALAVALLRWVGALRDGRLLLTLAVLFAVDPTFTYQRCAVDDPHWGLAVSAIVVILAGAKLFLAANLLGLRVNLLALGTTLSLAAVVLATAAIPLFSAEPHRAFVLAWCSAALLPALHTLLRSATDADPGVESARSRWLLRTPPALHVLPYAAILAHLAAAHFILNASFHLCYLSPIMLVGAMAADAALRRNQPSTAASLGWWLPLGAITVCLLSGDALISTSLGFPWITVFRTVMLLSAAAFGLAFAWHRHWRSAIMSAATLAVGISARGPLDLIGTLRAGAPSSLGHWAAIGIVAAFLLLGAGTWVSIIRRTDEERQRHRPAPSR